MINKISLPYHIYYVKEENSSYHKYVNLDNSCLTKIEKTQVRDLLYKYKDAFSLRYEIGLCSNTEIEIDITDKSPFFIRPFHANEENKIIVDKK